MTPDALRAVLDALPGAVADPYTPPRSAGPLSLLYKVGGKMFAIMTLRGALYVVIKAPPFVVRSASRDAMVAATGRLE